MTEIIYSGLPQKESILVEDDDESYYHDVDDLVTLLGKRMSAPKDEGPLGLKPPDRPSFLVRVDFDHTASLSRPTSGILSLWQFPPSPTIEFLEQIYWCENPECMGVLTKEVYTGDHWICPVCHVAWTPEIIGSGMYYFRLSMDDWGELLAKRYDRLRGLAEVLLMRRRVSVQDLTRKVLAGEKDAEVAYLNSFGGESKTSVSSVYYTMRRIHKEIGANANLAMVFTRFFKGG